MKIGRWKEWHKGEVSPDPESTRDRIAEGMVKDGLFIGWKLYGKSLALVHHWGGGLARQEDFVVLRSRDTAKGYNMADIHAVQLGEHFGSQYVDQVSVGAWEDNSRVSRVPASEREKIACVAFNGGCPHVGWGACGDALVITHFIENGKVIQYDCRMLRSRRVQFKILRKEL